MSTLSQSLPQWILPRLYGDLEQVALDREIMRLQDNLAALDSDIQQCRLNSPLSTSNRNISAEFEQLADRYNRALTDYQNLHGYLTCLLHTNSRDDVSLTLYGQLQRLTGSLTAIETSWVAWLSTLDRDAVAVSSVVNEYDAMFTTAEAHAQHRLPVTEARIVGELVPTGSAAWAQLASLTRSQMLIALPQSNQRHTLADGALAAMLYGPNRDVRQRAYTALVEAFDTVALPFASALNSIKGETVTVTRYRGLGSPLDAALFDSQISRETFDAILAAVRASLPTFRRYLALKAHILQVPRLGFYDLLAPIVPPIQSFSFTQAQQWIVHQFSRFSDEAGAFAERAFNDSWIDALPRPNKQPGASCIVFGTSDSRISFNYRPSLQSVLTLAHELGHAYHYHCLARRPMLLRRPPLVLTETGSLFFETLVATALVEDSPQAARAESLNTFLQSGITSIVDVAGRVLFEQQLYIAREKRELSIDELKQLNVETATEVYGDILDPTETFPYAWAFLPQYYEHNFYNFPYLFGRLFALGLYTSFQQHPERFAGLFERLLESSGSRAPAALAAEAGIDIESERFWSDSIEPITKAVEDFEMIIRQRDVNL